MSAEVSTEGDGPPEKPTRGRSGKPVVIDQLIAGFKRCIPAFVESGMDAIKNWGMAPKQLDDRLKSNLTPLKGLFDAAGLPTLNIAVDRANRKVKLKLRPFVRSLNDGRETRAPLVDRLISINELRPRKEELVYLGTGTTMRFLAERFILLMEEREFGIVTDNIEVFGLCYFSGGKKMMGKNSLWFLGRRVVWAEGVLNPRRNIPESSQSESTDNNPKFQTVYLSATYYKDGEFITRDTTCQVFLRAALETESVDRIVFIMENNKFGMVEAASSLDGGGPIGFKELDRKGKEVFIVTDSLPPQTQKQLEEEDIKVITTRNLNDPRFDPESDHPQGQGPHD